MKVGVLTKARPEMLARLPKDLDQVVAWAGEGKAIKSQNVRRRLRAFANKFFCALENSNLAKIFNITRFYTGTGLVLLLLLILPSRISAQAFLINSNNRIQIGGIGGLEGGAYRARVNNASANWYNPAGLVNAKLSSISGDATLFEALEIEIDNVKSETTINQIPSFIGTITLGGEPGKRATFAYGWSVVVPVNMQSVFNRFSETNGHSVERDPFNPGTLPVVSVPDLEVQDESSSKLSITAPGFAVAFAPSRDFRWGIGIRVLRVELSEQETTTAHQEFSAGEPFFNYTLQEFVLGTATLVRLEGGYQSDIGKHIKIGGAFRSKTTTLSSNGKFKFSELIAYNIDPDNDNVFEERYTEFSFITDENTEFEFKLPGEFSFGIAWVYPSFEFEFDVIYHGKLSRFQMLGGVPVTTQKQTNAQGLQETGIDEAFVHESEAIINFSFGGSFKVGDFTRFHFGYFTDFSADNNNFAFNAIDLTGLTFGVSITTKKRSTSIGIIYMSGNNFEFFEHPITGETERRNVSFNSVGVVLAGSINF